MTGPPTIWSHTRLESHSQCGLKYRLHYLDRKPEAPVAAFENGRLLHAALAQYAEACLKSGRDQDLPLAKVIAANLPDRPQFAFLRFAERQLWDFRGLLGKAGEVFEGYHEVPVEPEEEWGRFCGRIDWLSLDEGALNITDWKSPGWQYPGQPEEPPRQLLLYGWLMLQELGPQVETVSLCIEPVGPLWRWQWDLDRSDFAGVEPWLRDRIAEASRFDPNEDAKPEPGSHCFVCGYRAACPRAAVIPYADLEDADLADEINVLEAKGREAKDERNRRASEQAFVDPKRGAWEKLEGPSRVELAVSVGELAGLCEQGKQTTEKLFSVAQEKVREAALAARTKGAQKALETIQRQLVKLEGKCTLDAAELLALAQPAATSLSTLGEVWAKAFRPVEPERRWGYGGEAEEDEEDPFGGADGFEVADQ